MLAPADHEVDQTALRFLDLSILQLHVGAEKFEFDDLKARAIDDHPVGVKGAQILGQSFEELLVGFGKPRDGDVRIHVLALSIPHVDF